MSEAVLIYVVSHPSEIVDKVPMDHFPRGIHERYVGSNDEKRYERKASCVGIKYNVG